MYHCSSRQLWESRMAEILMICNEASRRHKGVRVPGATNKPLSLEYVADRLDTDDPVSGYLVRTDDKFRWLQVHGRKKGARVCVCGGVVGGRVLCCVIRSGRGVAGARSGLRRGSPPSSVHMLVQVLVSPWYLVSTLLKPASHHSFSPCIPSPSHPHLPVLAHLTSPISQHPPPHLTPLPRHPPPLLPTLPPPQRAS